MHTEMWRHPATQANIATLRKRGVAILGPGEGELTGGDSGPGRMLEPEQIMAEALALIDGEEQQRDLDGLRVAVSAGGTREPLDPVRFLGNRSSGRQGTALALAAADRGAEVVLVAAHVDAAVLADAERHPLIRIEHTGTAAELGDAMRRASEDAAVIVMAAAVADYRPADVSEHKLSKESGPLESIELVQNEDIVAHLAARRQPGQVIVAFAAETPDAGEDLLERARRKRERKGVDLLVVNEVGWDRGFESGENAVHVIGEGGVVLARASGSKRAVADDIWDVIADALG
jgi:phosphopantothenoylcysteine decarboxylase/phosphopantothenate--cysteine ligase